MPAIKEENNTWTARFYYTDFMGNRKQKKKRGFSKKSDALSFERNFINQQIGCQETNFESVTIDYLTKCETKLKRSTFDRKRIVIEKHILPFFKQYNMIAITPKIISSWQSYVISNNELSESYLRAINMELSSIFTFAEKYYNLKTNVVKIADKMGKITRKNITIWLIEDMLELERVLSQHPILSRFILPLNLLYWTGMRVGELMALQLEDVENVTIHIHKTLNHRREITRPKTEKANREVIIDNKLACDLHDYIQTIYDKNPKAFLFDFHKSRLNYALDYAIKNSDKLSKIRIHDLRHSHASFLIKQGFSPLLISGRLGHDKPSTTLDIYGHLYPNEQNMIAETINKFRE